MVRCRVKNLSTEPYNWPLHLAVQRPKYCTHQNIARGKFTQDFTPKVAAKLWKGLAVSLNSCFGGPTKGWKEWRKTWQDIKASAKVKFGPLVRLKEGEADPSLQYTLNDFQRRVLAILRMNLTSDQGETTDPVLLFNGMVPVSNSPTYLSEYPTHSPPLLECASDDCQPYTQHCEPQPSEGSSQHKSMCCTAPDSSDEQLSSFTIKESSNNNNAPFIAEGFSHNKPSSLTTQGSLSRYPLTFTIHGSPKQQKAASSTAQASSDNSFQARTKDVKGRLAKSKNRKSSSFKYLKLSKTSKAVNIFAKSQNTSLELCKRELQLRRQRFMFERRRHREEMVFRRESEDARLALKRRSLDIYQELARSALQVGSQLVGAFDRLAKSLESTRVDNPSKVQ
uniref:Regulatory protein zeste n=1 Tax=Timema tahoe TaxID=61484 RepID=A0A7R9IGK8_9NEOP|nr:unnamed protein product [Timema tahoe]